MGSESEYNALDVAIKSLRDANTESLVQFLHITLNNLCYLLLRPTVIKQSADISKTAFEGLIEIINRVQNLDLQVDKHGRNRLLSSYIQYVFSAPVVQYTAGPFDSITATLSKATVSATSTGSSAFTKVIASDYEDLMKPTGKKSGAEKLFHEQLVYQWILAYSSTTQMLVRNIPGLSLKSCMANYLSREEKLNAPRVETFSDNFQKDLETLICAVTVDICRWHVLEEELARKSNTNLAFFIRDCFSLMDRGFVFTLIRTYLMKIVCSHEHYVALNLPLGEFLYPMGSGSRHVSTTPSGSISSMFENHDIPDYEAMGELSQEFKMHHYLSGLVLSELALVLDSKNSILRLKGINILCDLLASHDSDFRYNSPEDKAVIASIYLPLLSIAMDSYNHLYKYNLEENVLSLSNTCKFLICFLWVLKNVHPELVSHWWNTLSVTSRTSESGH